MSLDEFPKFHKGSDMNMKIGSMAIYANERQIAKESLFMHSMKNSMKNPLEKIEQEDGKPK